MKKTYGELIEYYENVSPREIIADMYFDYKEEIDNLNNLGKQLVEENEQLKDRLQQKENIIKEVREYINHYETIRGYFEYEELGYDEYNYDEDLKKELLEILDKENRL